MGKWLWAYGVKLRFPNLGTTIFFIFLFEVVGQYTGVHVLITILSLYALCTMMALCIIFSLICKHVSFYFTDYDCSSFCFCG